MGQSRGLRCIVSRRNSFGEDSEEEIDLASVIAEAEEEQIRMSRSEMDKKGEKMDRIVLNNQQTKDKKRSKPKGKAPII